MTYIGHRRGALVETVALREDVTDTRAPRRMDDDEVIVELTRKICKLEARRYERLGYEQYRRPAYGAVAGATVGVGVGAGVLAAGQHLDVLPLTLLGGLMFGGAAAGIAANVIKKSVNGSRPTGVLAERDEERHEVCAEPFAFIERRAQPWTLAMAGVSVRGKTSSRGVLSLREAVAAALTQVAPADAARRFTTAATLDLEVTMGDRDARPLAIEGWRVEVPLAQWAAWYRAMTLPPEAQVHWDACKDLEPMPRSALACLASGRHPRIIDHWRKLERDPSGAWGALHELEGRRPQAGDHLVIRLLLPAEDADYLVQILDLETGVVVTEAFSSRSRRFDVAATLPRASTYAIVVNAPEPGRYRSLITLTTKGP